MHGSSLSRNTMNLLKYRSAFSFQYFMSRTISVFFFRFGFASLSYADFIRAIAIAHPGEQTFCPIRVGRNDFLHSPLAHIFFLVERCDIAIKSHPALCPEFNLSHHCQLPRCAPVDMQRWQLYASILCAEFTPAISWRCIFHYKSHACEALDIKWRLLFCHYQLTVIP